MSVPLPETREELHTLLGWISEHHTLDLDWVDQIADALALPLAENPLLAAWGLVVPDGKRSSMWRLPDLSDAGYGRDLAESSIRRFAASRYAWAVPDDDALTNIALAADGRGVIEVGAGLGYWAGLLRERGVDVFATDAEPLANHWCVPAVGPWAEVECWDGIEAAAAHPDRLLLLCWPPMEAWTGDAVEAYWKAGGRTVAYIGEGAGGCTGDTGLWDALGMGGHWGEDDPAPVPSFEVRLDVEVPQWYGIHDRLLIAERIRPAAASPTSRWPTAESSASSSWRPTPTPTGRSTSPRWRSER